MKFLIRHFFTLSLLSILLPNLAQSQITIISDKPQGIYEVGQTVQWNITLDEGNQPDSVRYSLKKGGLTVIEKGPLNFNNKETTLTYTFNEPGTILLDIRWGAEDNRKNKAVGGAVAAPDQLKLSSSKPNDFDEFWASKVAELAKTPSNPILEKGDSEMEDVDYWKISMNNIRDMKIQGQLARPKKGEKLPALLIVQWAGVYPLQKQWATNKAKDGWLVLNINPHDLPINNEDSFYKEQFQNELKNYWSIGNDNRDESYFLRMYLSCYRAAQYLTERPDWNGETLVVMGTSQGGQQAIMTAGFHPAITAALALVPAGFDMLGPEVGRKGGWPQWHGNTEGKKPKKVYAASKYFDVANFVTRIKCPVLVGVGLLDETCPPEGILAGVNQLSTPKKIMILPKSGHQDHQGSQEPYQQMRDNVWLPALMNGEIAPVN